MTRLGPQLELKVLQLFQEGRAREPRATYRAILRQISAAHFRIEGSEVLKQLLLVKPIQGIIVRNRDKHRFLRKRRDNPIDRFEAEIKAGVANAADLYLDEIQLMLGSLGAPKFSISTVQRALIRCGLPLRNPQVKAAAVLADGLLQRSSANNRSLPAVAEHPSQVSAGIQASDWVRSVVVKNHFPVGDLWHSKFSDVASVLLVLPNRISCVRDPEGPLWSL